MKLELGEGAYLSVRAEADAFRVYGGGEVNSTEGPAILDAAPEG